MISLILPPKDDVARAQKMLGDEFGTAQNIKSRVNRLSVLSAIKSTQERLKLYHRVPKFGLVVYCGTILTEDNKEKKVTIDFEPFKPINTSLYLCDNKFHTEALQALLQATTRNSTASPPTALPGWGCGGRNVVAAVSPGQADCGVGFCLCLRWLVGFMPRCAQLTPIGFLVFPLQSDDKWGFIIMDGNGTLFGTLSGNTKETIHKVSVELPKKHGRGGQSAMRFARLRLEKRHNYVVKIAELSNSLFLSNDRINVSGLILAGSADFKTVLSANDVFDARLQCKIISIVDIAYGGENGFQQAIELSSQILGGVKFIKEKKLLTEYFDRIAIDSGNYCFGITDTMRALEMGAVETLMVYEDLETERLVLKNPTTGDDNIVKLLTPEEMENNAHFKTPEGDLETTDKMPLVEWLCEHYKDFGAIMEFVTNKSTEGSQFCRGFGGIGGLLRYKVDFVDLQDAEMADDDTGFDDDVDVDDFEDCFI